MEKTEQLTNEYIAKELSRLREIRERLENEYEYMAFSCRHGIGDVEANKAEAHRLGRILGKKAITIEKELQSNDTKRKNNDTQCKNPKNKEVVENLNYIMQRLLNTEDEVVGCVLNIAIKSYNTASPMMVKGSQEIALSLIATLIYSISGCDINRFKEIMRVIKEGTIKGDGIGAFDELKNMEDKTHGDD